MLDKARYYLQRESLRERIAAAGRAEVLARDTYRHRMEWLLREVERGLARTVTATPIGASPLPPTSLPSSSPVPAGSLASSVPAADPVPLPISTELLSILPTTAQKILVLGFEARLLVQALSAGSQAAFEVIDFGEELARAATVDLDVRLAILLEAHSPGLSNSFDAILCDNAVEYLRDPLGLLRRVHAHLTPGGAVVVSVPTVRNEGILRMILDGFWPISLSRMPERDPIRFFTRRSIQQLLERTNFLVGQMKALLAADPETEAWLRKGRPNEVQVGGLRINGLTEEEGAEFYASRLVFRAAPIPAPRNGLTSIVVLSYNQLTYTRACLESIRARTDEPFELIVVDNGSTDGTPEYLRSLPWIKVILNAENRGFPAGCNQGIQEAAGSQVVLLNNDTIVTTGWLTRLLRAMSSDMLVGLVGPCSNRISGEQQVAVSYGEDLSRLDQFAWEWGKLHHGKREETDRLVGFCLLIRREVIDRIGLLDERFGIGCFEDDDYCLRARRAGYRLIIARDAFVHHFAGRTFIGTGTDFAGLMEHNQRLFHQKWAEILRTEVSTPDAAPPPAIRYSCQPQPGGGLQLVQENVELSLCMIVRDNAGTIRACLESIRPWVDEMVVVDTGSRDETPQIAAQLGARVFHFTWCDDFSAARNESIRHARGRWIFWMDSDDTISAECGRKLRETIARATPQTAGFVCQVHCPAASGGDAVEITVVDHLKLFRNLPGVRFDHRIHEQVLPAITQAGGFIEFTDIYVVHSGYDHSPEGQQRKLERDLRLLNKELEERPEHTFTLFNLGMTFTHVRRYDEAVGYLRRSLAAAGERDSHLRKAYNYLVTCHQGLGQIREAWEVCWEGLSRFPNDAELRFRRAMLLHQEQRLGEAAEAYQELLRHREGDHFKSVVAGLHGYMTRHNLALIYQETGDHTKAEEQWRLVVQERAGYRPGWRGLGTCLVAQGKQSEARSLAGSLLQNERLRAEGMLLRGQIAASEGDLASACDDWQRVVEAASDKDALELVCRLLFEQAGPPRAEKALETLLRCDPTNAVVHHNLGQVYLSTGRAARAVDAFRESLKHRPASAGTLFQLGQALEASGQVQEAVRTWEEVLRISPQDRNAQEALQRISQSGVTKSTENQERQEPEVQATETVYSLRLGTKESRVRFFTRGVVDRAIVRDLWERDVYGIREIYESPRTVIDIGAHIGTFAILVSEAWPGARVIACEADPENCLLLQRNLQGRQNVEVVEAAVVAENVSEVSFNSVADKALYNSGGGSCIRKEPGSIWKKVPAISVVKLWEVKRIGICDLLKLDCEGAEVSLLQALASASYLAKMRRIVGEWHALDRIARDGKRVRAQLMEILQSTHEVVFRPPLDGTEGHFVARAR